MQPDFSTKHIARVKPSQYIAQLATAAEQSYVLLEPAQKPKTKDALY